MASSMFVMVLALVVALAEARVLTVQGPLPPSSEAGLQAVLQQVGLEQGLQRGLQQLQGLQGLQQALPGARTIQVTVPSMDVEPLRRFLRSHYRMFWLRMFPTTHTDGDVFAAPDGSRCDADNCYSTCFLEGFDGGECDADAKCRCSIVPRTMTATTEAATSEASGS